MLRNLPLTALLLTASVAHVPLAEPAAGGNFPPSSFHLPHSSLLLPPFSLAMAQTPSHTSNMPPEAEKQLARDIYKEFIEIKSGYTTGATTPVAEAAARRLKAAGFPASDIFVGGAIPTKANLVVRYHGSGARRPLLL